MHVKSLSKCSYLLGLQTIFSRLLMLVRKTFFQFRNLDCVCIGLYLEASGKLCKMRAQSEGSFFFSLFFGTLRHETFWMEVRILKNPSSKARDLKFLLRLGLGVELQLEKGKTPGRFYGFSNCSEPLFCRFSEKITNIKI